MPNLPWTRRATRLLSLFVWLLLLGQVASPRQASPTAPTADDRPNLVLLVTDDHPHDALGCAGHPALKTPHMDALASRGVRFSRAFVTTPICAASRASILSGMYERSHGYTFGQPSLSETDVQASYPFQLRRAGYRVGLVGKLGVKISKEDREAMFDTLDRGTLPYFKGSEPAPGKHLTERNVDRAIAFVQAKGDAPFCLSLSFQAPHAEDSNPAQYLWPTTCNDLYSDLEVPEPSLGDEAFFDALPPFLREGLNRERWFWRFDTPEKREQMVRGYYRMLSGVDMGIGRLVEAIEGLDSSRRTVIVLMGDNGYFLGERGYAGKWTMHDRSTRVPLIVVDPAAPAARRGAVETAFALNIDLSPTLLDLAGVPIPDLVQGRSLLPALAGTEETPRAEVFTEHLWKFDRIPRTEAIRTERWKFIRYPDHPEFEELYDLEADPEESVNLAADPAHAKRRDALREQCAKAATVAADSR